MWKGMKETIYKIVILFLLFICSIAIFDNDVDMDAFEKGLENSVNGQYPYINENTTIKQIEVYYYSYYPLSRGLMG